jgi:hypothetical protein
MRRPAVEALAVLSPYDRAFVSFADGEVERASRAWHDGDQRGFVAFADYSQDPVASLKGHVLDVGSARLADPKTVQAQEHSERSVRVVEAFCGEEESS